MICASILFTGKNDVLEYYNDFTEPNGFVVSIDDSVQILTDELATENNDWQRQIDITEEISKNALCCGLSLFSIENDWAVAVSIDGVTTVAGYSHDFNDAKKERLAVELNDLMGALVEYLAVDEDWLNNNFGALYLGIIGAEEFFNSLLTDVMSCSAYWIRWSYYDEVIKNLITDPDLSSMVTATGNAKEAFDF